MIDIKELRRLAEAAKQDTQKGLRYSSRIADYIEATPLDTILALLDELEQLKEDLAFTITAYKGADLERARLIEVEKAAKRVQKLLNARHYNDEMETATDHLNYALDGHEACADIEETK